MSEPNVIHSFPPLLGDTAQVMVLGSMPGMESLKAQQYYAHPRNAFWSIMGRHFNFSVDLSYTQRCQALTARRLLIWDVLQACVRPGSLDAAIQADSEVTNDFAKILQAHPIRSILFNGAKAEKSFLRHVLPTLKTAPIELRRLPSTSPAYAAMSLAAKQSVWSDALTDAGLPAQIR